MSDEVFPLLRGLSLGIKKKPEFKTIQQTSVLGIDKTLSLVPYPKWTFTIGYEYLLDKNSVKDDIQKLIGFYINRMGKYDDWLYYDLYDNYCNGQEFGTGDGSTTTFQLCRSWGGFIEPVIGVLDDPVITIDGVPTTAFTYTSKGKVTFTTAPSSSATLAWTGGFYYRCRFTEDEQEFEEILNGIWKCDSVIFKSVLI